MRMREAVTVLAALTGMIAGLAAPFIAVRIVGPWIGMGVHNLMLPVYSAALGGLVCGLSAGVRLGKRQPPSPTPLRYTVVIVGAVGVAVLGALIILIVAALAVTLAFRP